ncbi:MAG TPA: glutamate formimidoyltransferase [Gaiellaceae bacterium]|nr:glutamate formimidoyltransferase [Gaiellaceae bacterium]
MLPLEAVPNFSEGRDSVLIGLLGSELAERAHLLDIHTDPDHNRSVFTLVGDDSEVVDALVAAVAVAQARIDLRRHEGVHPRIGAADVVPIVPIRPEDMERARATALTLAERIGGELGLPVFLYGELGGGRNPAFFRRGGALELQQRIDVGELAPDFGPAQLDASAGGVLIGARAPLIAFNVDLAGDDLDAVREVARAVRERDGGFPGVRALGLRLPRAGHVQISLNVEDWRASPLHEVVAAVHREAAQRGLHVTGSELVGLLPAGAAVAAAGSLLDVAGLDPSHVLELRLLDE